MKAWDVDRQPRLLIGFDVSESMDTADQHASEAEMLLWGRSLGMLGSEATSQLIDNWVLDYAQNREPDWVNGDDAALGEVRRRQVMDVFEEFRRMPRTEFVRRLLQARPNDLLENLQKQTAVELQVFGMEQLEMSSDGLNDFLQSDRSDVRPVATDLAGMLSNAITKESGTSIQGLVLITDGKQTAGGNPETEAERMKSLQIPIYTVPIGSVMQPRDLSIAGIDAPKTVFIDDTTVVRATVRADGYEGQEVTVFLKNNDQIVDQMTTTVTGAEFPAEFEIPSEAVGSTDYTLSVDRQPGELRDDNNSRPFTVSVVDNKSRVMLVEGDARWEFRYLKNALERDKQVRLNTVLFRQPYLKLLNKPFLDSTLPDIEELRRQLSQTDILIVGDVDPQNFGKEIWKVIEQAVSDEGLTLFLIPGRRHLPVEHQSAALDRLLPITDPQQQIAERYQRSLPDSAASEFRLQPTAAVDRMAIFNLSDAASSQSDFLQTLPGHLWAYTGTAKPVATEWATLEIPGPELTEPLAAVVHHYYGFGQVVWMGVDSTWRWRFRAGDTWHHRFWGQVVRWAARSKASAGNDQVRMTLSSSVINESEAADVAVRWDSQVVQQLKGAMVSLKIERLDPKLPDEQADSAKDVQNRTVQLTPQPNAPSRFNGRIENLPPGTFKVTMKVENSDLLLKQEIGTELVVKPEVSTELADVRCQREFLQQLSQTTGGQLLEPWQLASLPELLRKDQESDNMVQEVTAWDHWGLMLIFFALLATEWVVRKLNGLP